MKNFIQHGKTCTFVAPYDLESGDGFQVGALFAVANADAVAGEEVEGDLEGVFELPGTTGAGTDHAAGTMLYWDDADRVVTETAAGNMPIGASIKPKTAAAASVTIRLNGVAAPNVTEA